MNYLYSEITEQVIGFAIEIHKELGPGLFESVYKKCMAYELSKAGINFQLEVECPILYKEINIASAFRIDLIVDDKIIIELKSVDKLNSVHEAQILTYLKLYKKQIGLLMNFNEKLLKDGIKRNIL